MSRRIEVSPAYIGRLSNEEIFLFMKNHNLPVGPVNGKTILIFFKLNNQTELYSIALFKTL